MIKVVLLLLFLLILTLLIHMYREAFSDKVFEMEIALTNFPAQFGEIKIFFISDIHRRKISDTIISKVAGKAEIVLIGGDLAEKGVSYARIEENIRKLKEIGPVYFIWGNNDYEIDPHELDALLLSMGVKILDNTAVIFESAEGETIALLGVDDITAGRCQLHYAIEDAGNASFKILACHNPAILDSIIEEHGIGLVLSGHTHGGQIRLFGIGPYKKGGFRQVGSTPIFTSNGYGTSLLPLRLGARAETHILTIKNSSI
ncbi:metallophosphoesterase [Bacillus massilinigeriensis]|uniref:metallophosphoesterase n=1 Tax=Bacillus mediterraneensis TaxID=1805474 RepID=UPI0008F92970|nr:metallophosphoesterase [Bacillus mediterraneensis]